MAVSASTFVMVIEVHCPITTVEPVSSIFSGFGVLYDPMSSRSAHQSSVGFVFIVELTPTTLSLSPRIERNSAAFVFTTHTLETGVGTTTSVPSF